MVVIKRVKDESKSRPKEDAEEKNGLVAEEFVTLVEDKH